MNNRLHDRAYLHNRHRLSHQQIDNWLGENRAKEFIQEKFGQLEAVKNFLFVTDLLSKDNIVFTCFKGPLLSFRIYNDPTIRISHDIDLLIDQSELCKTIQTLTQNSFQLTEGTFWPEKKTQQELYFKALHHLSFYNKELKTCVEIHWVLMHELPVSQKKIQQIINRNKTNIEFSGRTFTVFSLEFELLYLLIHGARHGWNRLKWMIDIKDYPMQKINTTKFEDLATQLQAWRIIAQVNILLKYFFKIQMPFSKKTRVPSFFINYAFHFIDDENSQRLLTRDMFRHLRYLWFLFPGILYKWQIITQCLFRPGDLTEIDSPHKIMYYLYRPYSFIRRRILHV